MNEYYTALSTYIYKLKEVLNMDDTTMTRDAAIHRFKLTTDLAWKSIQKFLREEKITCRSPKECLKEAFKLQLVRDNGLWLEAFEDRNLTVHTYNEQTAKEVFGRIPNYIPLFEEVLSALQQRINTQ